MKLFNVSYRDAFNNVTSVLVEADNTLYARAALHAYLSERGILGMFRSLVSIDRAFRNEV